MTSHDIPTPPTGLPLNHPAPSPQRRTMFVVGGVVALALLSAGIAAISGAFDDDAPGGELDLTQQSSVATTFVQRYAQHDPAACELANTALRSRLTRDGRCTGTATGAAPAITVLVSRTCGDRHGFTAEVTPSGAIGAPYFSVGLELTGETWAVRTVLPLTDRAAIRDYDCAAPATGYGGS